MSCLSSKFMMYHYMKTLPDLDTEDVYLRTTMRNPPPTGDKDPYPWLESDDPWQPMSDLQILYDCIDLSDSLLSSQEESKLMAIIVKYKKAFSLRNEIGHCPNLKVDLKVIDNSSFFVCPFLISETDKPFMDHQMECLISLGILSRNSTSHTSPVMLITCKLTKDKIPVVDFTVLHLPRVDCRVFLHSDTSREGTGSSLWQVQEGKPQLIRFPSKTLPEACMRYSVTELEMTGLLVNMGLWKSII